MKFVLVKITAGNKWHIQGIIEDNLRKELFAKMLAGLMEILRH